MRNRSYLLPLAVGLLLTGFPAGAALGAESDSIDTDLTRLRTALLPTDNAGLVNYLRLRTRREPSPDTLHRLIESLHAATPATREQACAELVAIGKPALPLLRAVVAKDPDTRALARDCRIAIETDNGTLTVAVVHLLAHRRSPGTAGVLLEYLPHAENESVLAEIQEALNTVARDPKGTVGPAVVGALDDKHPSRRAAAVIALSQGDVSRHRAALRKLLLDPAPNVRWHAARALARAAEPEAVSTLIALLGDEGDRESRETVEDFLADLAGPLGPKVRGNAQDVWARWWRDTEGPGLLNELRRRTPTDADRERVRTLIRKLGDDSYRVRQQAAEDLVRMEERALPQLKQVVKDPPDLEMRKRSELCVALIETVKEEFRGRLPAIARLIALRKPPEATETILAYMPYLDDDGLLEELQHALDIVGFKDGKPQPALLAGLADKSGIRRAAAAQALCAGRRADHVETVRKLLKDPEPPVRLKAALALAGARDAAAVPALIALVGDLPPEQSADAEDYLSRLAGDAAPEGPPGAEGDRKARSAAWSAWWQANKDKVVLLDPAALDLAATGSASIRGYTLLVQPQTNTVTELDRDGKPRWSLTGLSRPRDAQVLSGSRVLVAEQNRVTERDLRGKVLWQKVVPQPLSVQRLRNGHSFIACPDRLIEVDRAGKEVLKVSLNRRGVAAARRLLDGRIVVFSGGNDVVQLDKTGRELKRTPVNCGGAGCDEVLDNGHVLALSPGNGNLIEFDIDGKLVNRFDVSGAAHAFRLPNGHTLLTVNGRKYIELDKKWQPIKETSLPTPAFRVKRR